MNNFFAWGSGYSFGLIRGSGIQQLTSVLVTSREICTFLWKSLLCQFDCNFRKLYSALRTRITQLRFGISNGTAYHDRVMEMNFAIDESVCQNGEEALVLLCEEAQDHLYFFEATLLKFNHYCTSRKGMSFTEWLLWWDVVKSYL